MTFWIGRGDLADTMLSSSRRVEIDAGRLDPLVGRIDVINEETNPRAEGTLPLVPIRHRAIEPDLAGTDNQFHVADDPVLIGPALPLDESENLDQPIGHGASIGAEHIGDHASGRW